jgi:Ca2+-binding RTX toxin-like protein
MMAAWVRLGCAGHFRFEFPLAVGTAGDDTIDLTGTGYLVLGLDGDDRIRVTGEDAVGGGSWILGGAGDDDITTQGYGHRVYGGSGADRINFFIGASSSETGNFADGGGGDDWILSVGSQATLLGGAGNDQITAQGQYITGNLLDGGAGDDTLDIYGVRNELRGGAGDDLLMSRTVNADRVYGDWGAGNTLFGGAGQDRFELNFGTTIRVDNDHDRVVGEGDVLRGLISRIGDYSAGEVVQTGATRRYEGELGVAPTLPPEDVSPVLERGSFVVYQGREVEPGYFEIAGDGPETLYLYNPADGLGTFATSMLIVTGDAGIIFA